MDTLRPRSDANRGTGEWLVPGTTRDSNVQGPGKKAQIAQGLFAVKERWRLRGWERPAGDDVIGGRRA